MAWSSNGTALRALPQLLQILRVLTRHKFLGTLLERSQWPAQQELCETIEELGLVFLKFGQVLAMRSDLLPPAYVDELAPLHDQSPEMDIKLVRATIEAELGRPIKQIFSTFNEVPMGAATIAQVHEATLRGLVSRTDYAPERAAFRTDAGQGENRQAGA